MKSLILNSIPPGIFSLLIILACHPEQKEFKPSFKLLDAEKIRFNSFVDCNMAEAWIGDTFRIFPGKYGEDPLWGDAKDLKLLPHQQLFFSWLKYGELQGYENPNNSIDTLNDLFRYRIILFTGIANPSPMLTYLKEYASDVIHIEFRDHHSYTLEDISRIRTKFDELEGGNKILVTTEKDAMRLKGTDLEDVINTLPLYTLPIEVDFKDKTQEFNQLIINYVRTNKFYHRKYS